MNRKCQWCGVKFTTDHPSKQFCSRAHKDEAGNYMASRGKIIMPMLLAWRAKRGRKGTSGAAAYQEMQQFVDRCVAELAEQGVPSSSAFFETPRQSGSGATTWRDCERKRPSRIETAEAASGMTAEQALAPNALLADIVWQPVDEEEVEA